MTGWRGEGGWSDISVAAGPPATAPVITKMRTVPGHSAFWDLSSSGGTTRSNNLTLFGSSAYAGATVTVYRDGALQGTTTTDGSGNWTFATGLLGDTGYNFTATVTPSGLSVSPQSSAFNITVVPDISNVAIGVNVPNFTMDIAVGFEAAFFTENATANTNACVFSDTHTINFDSLATDSRTEDSTNKTSLTAGFSKYADGTTFNLSYEFLMNGSDPVNNSGLSSANGGLNGFVDLIRLTDEAGVLVFKFYLGDAANGDALGVQINTTTGTPTWQFPYVATSNLSRGVWHRVELALKPAASGAFCQIWLDGTQIVNTTALRGTSPYHWEFGFNRGPVGAPPQTQRQRVSYRNAIFAYAAPASALPWTPTVPMVTNFNGTDGVVWTGIDGKMMSNHNPNNSYNCTSPDPQTMRYEIRSGEHVTGETNERCECQHAFPGSIEPPEAGNSQVVKYEFRVDGPAIGSWFFICGQIYSSLGGSPPFYIGIENQKQCCRIGWRASQGGTIPVEGSASVGGQTVNYGYPWRDTVDFVKGVWHTMQITCNFAGNSVVIIRDGVTVCNYSGPVGFGGNFHYDHGIYRSGPTTGETHIIQYRNMIMTP